MRRKRSLLLTLLLAGTVLLTLLGFILVGAYLYLTRKPKPPLLKPLAVVDVEALVPSLALRTLAGEPEWATLQAALGVGDLDAAYATVVFSPSLNEAARAGHLLLLAQRYSAAGREEQAAICLQQVHSLIVLSPSLSDIARADAALQAASGWMAIGRQGAARLSLKQAEAVAAQGLHLRPAQRRDLWQRLATAYASLGDEEKAAAARERAERAPGPAAQPEPSLLPSFLGELPPSEEIEQLQAARQERAATLIRQWIALEGGDVGPEVADLAEFLRREDAARMSYLDQIAETTPHLATQAAVARERAIWLTLKYRIARRGFGLSLMPEWEEKAPLIRSQLIKAYETLFRLYGDEASALPEVSDADRARVELLREEILLGRLGLYPDCPEDQLVQRLQEAQERLRGARVNGLWVTFRMEDGQRIFTLEGTSGE